MSKKILFIGSKDSGLACLKIMQEIAPDQLIGAMTLNDESDSRSILGDFISYCKETSINLNVVNSRKESEQVIKDLQPDLCIVVGWYWILSKEVLSVAKYGFVGVHNSLLPKYRGGAPLVWAMINGDNKIGFSFFSFTEGMDDGDIWFQKEINISDTMFINQVLDIVNVEILSAFRAVFPRIINNDLTPKKQEHQNATYCALRIPEDGLINWNKTSDEIYNFIRAQSKPYPGAFSIYKNEKLKIWDAEKIEMKYMCTPGQVISYSDVGVVVGCGENTVILLKFVEFEGNNLKANKVLNSINIRL